VPIKHDPTDPKEYPMNFSRDDSKNGPKQDAGHASVTMPSTPDANKGDGPAQAGQKGGDAKPGVQAPGAADAGNPSKSDGKDGQQDAKSGPSKLNAAAPRDHSDSDAMVSEGGHAAPGATPSVVREPDASIIAKDEPPRGSADVAADKYGL
jgi:hypothetical protein